MQTATIPSRKKLISLKEDTFKSLSIMAIQHGTNLKHFIETLLDRVASDGDDARLYEYLTQTDPEGNVMLGAKEKEDFERRLNV